MFLCLETDTGREFKYQFLNYLVGQAKLLIYSSRRNRVGERAVQEEVPLFVSLTKAIVWVDYRYYKDVNNMQSFTEKWCYEDVLCCLKHDQLIFTGI